MDCSPPGSSVHGILQPGYWSGLPFPSPGDLLKLGIEPLSLALAGELFTTSATWEACIIHMLFSHSVMSYSLRPHGLQHARLPCPSTSSRACTKSCPLSQWCHSIITFSVIPFISCPQSFPASRPFPVSQFFASGGHSIRVSASASVLPMNIQDWFPLGWTSWITLKSKGLSRVFSNTTVQKHQFFGAYLCLWSKSHIHTWPLEKP